MASEQTQLPLHQRQRSHSPFQNGGQLPSTPSRVWESQGRHHALTSSALRQSVKRKADELDIKPNLQQDCPSSQNNDHVRSYFHCERYSHLTAMCPQVEYANEDREPSPSEVHTDFIKRNHRQATVNEAASQETDETNEDANTEPAASTQSTDAGDQQQHTPQEASSNPPKPRGRVKGGRRAAQEGAFKRDRNAKPPYSYAALIGQAIMSTTNNRISLADIYNYIQDHYPFYKKEDAGWQNSIRHNLSLNDCFIKTPRAEGDAPGKGSLWCIVPGREDQFADGNFVKRGAHKKGRGGARKPATERPASNDAPVDLKSSMRKGKGKVTDENVEGEMDDSQAGQTESLGASQPASAASTATSESTLSQSQSTEEAESRDESKRPTRASKRRRTATLRATSPEPLVQQPLECRSEEVYVEDDSEDDLDPNPASPPHPAQLPPINQQPVLARSQNGYHSRASSALGASSSFTSLIYEEPSKQRSMGPLPPMLGAPAELLPPPASSASRHLRQHSGSHSLSDLLRSPPNAHASNPFPFLGPPATHVTTAGQTYRSPEAPSSSVFGNQTSPYLPTTGPSFTQSPVSSMRSSKPTHMNGEDVNTSPLTAMGRSRAGSSPPAMRFGNESQRGGVGGASISKSAEDIKTPPALLSHSQGPGGRSLLDNGGLGSASRALQFLQSGPAGGFSWPSSSPHPGSGLSPLHNRTTDSSVQRPTDSPQPLFSSPGTNLNFGLGSHPSWSPF